MVRVVADRTLRCLSLGIGRNGRIALRFVFRNRVRYSEGELNRENRNLQYLFHFAPTFCHSLDRSEVGRRHA